MITLAVEQLEPRDLLTGNPVSEYAYAPVAGQLFHPKTSDLGPLMHVMTTTAEYNNLGLQSLIVALANESPTARTYGVDYTDVRQGAIGDCGLIAGMGEVAHRKPWLIPSLFTENADGTLTVELRAEGGSMFVTMTRDLPAYQGQLIYAGLGTSVTDTNAVLWDEYLEKALAQYCGSYRGFYGTLDGIEGVYAWEEMAYITGTLPLGHTYGVDRHSLFVNAWNNGDCVCLQTPVNEPNPGIVPNHVYFVLAYDAATDTVTLGNPWTGGVNPVVESWAQVQTDFVVFDRVV